MQADLVISNRIYNFSVSLWQNCDCQYVPQQYVGSPVYYHSGDGQSTNFLTCVDFHKGHRYTHG